jgi:hypothetical protein
MKFETRIVGWRNFSNKWIVGADSIQTSSIKDHAITDQHNHAMTLLKKEQAQSHGEGPSSYCQSSSTNTRLWICQAAKEI